MKNKLNEIKEDLSIYIPPKSLIKWFMVIIPLAVVTISVAIWSALGYLMLESEIVTVTGKEVKSVGVELVQIKQPDGTFREASKNIDAYFVYTNHGAYRMQDTYYYFRWNTADEWGTIEEGKTYEFQHFGVRLTWFSIYENVIYFTEITE